MQLKVTFPNGQTATVPHVGMAADAPPIKAGPRRPLRRCEEPGLGDKVEAALKSIGITEEFVGAVLKKFGLPPDCGCAKRKAWLNSVSDWRKGQSRGP